MLCGVSAGIGRGHPSGRSSRTSSTAARSMLRGRRTGARASTATACTCEPTCSARLECGAGEGHPRVCGLRRASICAAALALHTESSSGTRSVPTASARITNMAVLPFRFSDLILSGHSFSWQVLAPPLLRCRSEACVGAAAARGTPECNAQQDNLQRSVKRKTHCCFQRATRDTMQRERLHSCTS